MSGVVIPMMSSPARPLLAAATLLAALLMLRLFDAATAPVAESLQHPANDAAVAGARMEDHGSHDLHSDMPIAVRRERLDTDATLSGPMPASRRHGRLAAVGHRAGQPRIEPRPALSISGRVLDEGGEPLPAIEVTAAPVGPSTTGEQAADRFSGHERYAFTDGDGQYTFHHLADGDYEIRAMAASHQGETRVLVRAGLDSADLVLADERHVWVHGVVRGPTGDPLAAVQVLRTGAKGFGTQTDRSGRYGLSIPVTDGWPTHTLLFVANGHDEQRLTFRDDGADQVPLDVSMERQTITAGVAGVVVSRRGDPVAGETVHLHSARTRHRYQTTSDASGRFFIADVGVGETYRVRVLPRNAFRNYQSQDFRLTDAGLRLAVVLDALEVGWITGRVVTIEGEPLAGFSLSLRSRAASGPITRVISDRQGYFTAHDVPAGQLVFESRSQPEFFIHGPNLVSKSTLHVPLVVDWGDFQVSGRITDSEGNPLAVRDVSLSWRHHENGITSLAERHTSADGRGWFRFSRLGRGRHLLKIDAPGFATVTRDYVVGERWDEINVRLEPR